MHEFKTAQQTLGPNLDPAPEAVYERILKSIAGDLDSQVDFLLSIDFDSSKYNSLFAIVERLKDVHEKTNEPELRSHIEHSLRKAYEGVVRWLKKNDSQLQSLGLAIDEEISKAKAQTDPTEITYAATKLQELLLACLPVIHEASQYSREIQFFLQHTDSEVNPEYFTEWYEDQLKKILELHQYSAELIQQRNKILELLRDENAKREIEEKNEILDPTTESQDLASEATEATESTKLSQLEERVRAVLSTDITSDSEIEEQLGIIQTILKDVWDHVEQGTDQYSKLKELSDQLVAHRTTLEQKRYNYDDHETELTPPQHRCLILIRRRVQAFLTEPASSSDTLLSNVVSLLQSFSFSEKHQEEILASIRELLESKKIAQEIFVKENRDAVQICFWVFGFEPAGAVRTKMGDICIQLYFEKVDDYIKAFQCARPITITDEVRREHPANEAAYLTSFANKAEYNRKFIIFNGLTENESIVSHEKHENQHAMQYYTDGQDGKEKESTLATHTTIFRMAKNSQTLYNLLKIDATAFNASDNKNKLHILLQKNQEIFEMGYYLIKDELLAYKTNSNLNDSDIKDHLLENYSEKLKNFHDAAVTAAPLFAVDIADELRDALDQLYFTDYPNVLDYAFASITRLQDAGYSMDDVTAVLSIYDMKLWPEVAGSLLSA